MNRRSFMSNSLLGGAAAPSLAAKLLRARTKPEAGTPSLETNAAEGAAQKLFPTNLPERQWLEFRAPWVRPAGGGSDFSERRQRAVRRSARWYWYRLHQPEPGWPPGRMDHFQ